MFRIYWAGPFEADSIRLLSHKFQFAAGRRSAGLGEIPAKKEDKRHLFNLGNL
ncbi:hypothetical protein [Methanocrinis sp.]|uniref:hypothetical protein n=1 Tax=Methanocrinis sp. TaxID=3101522 RepID=UPI003D0EB0A6